MCRGFGVENFLNRGVKQQCDAKYKLKVGKVPVKTKTWDLLEYKWYMLQWERSEGGETQKRRQKVDEG